jgi:hypothetical protein
VENGVHYLGADDSGLHLGVDESVTHCSVVRVLHEVLLKDVSVTPHWFALLNEGWKEKKEALKPGAISLSVNDYDQGYDEGQDKKQAIHIDISVKQ